VDMYSNEHGSSDFEEFIEFLGDKIQLSEWVQAENFCGGLSTHDGTQSVFTKWQNFEIMFHISTMLLHKPKTDPHFVEKKRHIGNDCVVIIFKEDAQPFSPDVMMSHFNHVYIVIQKLSGRKKDPTRYKISVSSKESVVPFKPLLPHPPIFEKGPVFRDFLLRKLINAERAAHYAPDFLERNLRNRKLVLGGLQKFA